MLRHFPSGVVQYAVPVSAASTCPRTSILKYIDWSYPFLGPRKEQNTGNLVTFVLPGDGRHQRETKAQQVLSQNLLTECRGQRSPFLLDRAGCLGRLGCILLQLEKLQVAQIQGGELLALHLVLRLKLCICSLTKPLHISY